MKTRFILLTLVLVFSRGCDFYSTSLWFFQEDGISGETNPLTKLFGMGWTGLVISNILIVGCIIYLLYYFYFRYKRQVNFQQQPKDYKELASLQYFGLPDKFYQVLYKIPKNKNVILAHAGYVLTITTIVGSFLATLHNLCQFYSVRFYNQYRLVVVRPLFVIYTLIALTLFLTLRRLLLKEYKNYRDQVI